MSRRDFLNFGPAHKFTEVEEQGVTEHRTNSLGLAPEANYSTQLQDAYLPKNTYHAF